MAPKRKADIQQPSLEETVERPVTKVKTRGTEKTVTQEGNQEDLVRAKMARKHGNDPAFLKKETKPSAKASSSSDKKDDSNAGEKSDYVDINRAPVLTLWVTVVAQRQEYSRNSALTFGKAIAGLMANAKGKSIGVIADKDPPDEDAKEKKRDKEGKLGVQQREVFGMEIKCLHESEEPRALDSSGSGDKTIDPAKVQQYLARAFKDRLGDVEDAMKELASSYSSEEIGSEAYHLYEQFRPNVVQGQQGWGKKGRLEFDRIRELKK